MIGSFMMVSVSAETQTIHNPYEYPILPGTSEWAELESFPEMIEACQIPENILNKMSTEALVETVLNYPLLGLYPVYKAQEIYSVYSDIFNGVEEMENRDDAGKVLLDKYSAETESGVTTFSNEISVDKSSFCEIFLSQSVFTEDLDDEELLQLDELLNKKMEQTQTLPLYYRMKGDISTLSLDSDLQNIYYDPTVITYNAVLYTPKYSKVTATQYGSDMPASTKTKYKNLFTKYFPNATLKQEACAYYNCHSYAWHSTSSTNKYWINDPSIYMSSTDGSYRGITVGSTTRPAQYTRVFYNKPGLAKDHSALVMGHAGGTGINQIICYSKWGQGGVYQHRLQYCPYYYNDTDMSFWIRNT